ncbi:MAG TPA: LuxR C-terminal-related transcriptional regulator [Gemmatimonadaceae bacterium]|nr:LuxR C-terminal-related transcriptional regulator [Gemmatimonadaceae bacterium]
MAPTFSDLLSSTGGASFEPRPEPGQAARPSRAFVRVLDLLAEGVLLVDSGGRAAHVNAALASMLREDDERDSLLREMRRLALAAPRPGAPPPRLADRADEPPRDDTSTDALEREARTATARYRIRAAAISDALAGIARPVVVTLERLTPQLPSAASLMAHFGLTVCEARVAYILMQGRTNDGIARTLKISPHTARHHTENVLLKLNAHSRGEAIGKLLGTRRLSGARRAM